MEKITRLEEQEIVTRFLNNKKRLKTLIDAQDDLAQIERWLRNLQEITAQRKEELELERIEMEDLEKQRLAMLEKIKAEGWDLKSLMNPVVPKASKSAAESKYAYPLENGKTAYWTGHGRMPNALKMLIEQGRTLEEFEN